ncbi:hypothetical protein BD779DRAFT_781418 [Infundibulicybe gibba]|nr:hypothetical protein BD779DRAFT_781418 [Infundibulicybe gibba]
MLATIDGFSAWVTIDGVKLPTYGVETTVDRDEMISCWIESEPGKAFEVGYSVPAHLEPFAGEFYVGGKPVGGFIHISGEPAVIIQSELKRVGAAGQPLIFSETTAECLSTNYISEIMVEIWVTANPPLSQDLSDINELLAEMCEHAKEPNISHQAAAVAVPPEFVTKIEHEYRVISFRFNYRQKDALQATDIIPPDLKPGGARPQKRTAETLELYTSGDEGGTEVQIQDKESWLRHEGLQV